MKKFALTLALLSMTTLAFAGCNNTEEVTEETPEATESTEVTPTPAPETPAEETPAE